ncbi:MAG TPA: cytochrome P450 [Blastocatellia bacterium]
MMRQTGEQTGRSDPWDPLDAVTHFDPYPYYARLVGSKPIYWDDDLKLWVASGAGAVKSVLTSNLCTVRPASEQVPRSIAGSAAGTIFQNLVRMTDGPRHKEMKGEVSAIFDRLEIEGVRDLGRGWAERLGKALAGDDAGALNDFMFRVPVFVMGQLLGLRADALEETAACVDGFVRCLSPVSTEEQIETGKHAAARLLEIFDPSAALGQTDEIDGLLRAFYRRGRPGGREEGDRTARIANAIGLLSQTYEATAGLIGNTILILARNDSLRNQVIKNQQLIEDVVAEVIRYDSPVQNTRRFVSSPGQVAGEYMDEGAAVLVLVAAANRDPAENPDPGSFLVKRERRRSFTFGFGAHGCPGEICARAIAAAAVGEFVRQRIDLVEISRQFTYRRSLNVRVPVFGSGKSGYL